jgi:hypothetical protein
MTNPSSRVTQWAESSRRLVNDASAIVLEANTRINDGTFTAEQWAKAVQELANLALTTGIDLVPQMLPFPCLPQAADTRDLSDFIKVDPDEQFQRILSVVNPFVQQGAPSSVIPSKSIFFAPPIVRVHATSFRIGVNWPNLRSGTYSGTVRLTQVGPANAGPRDLVVTIDL